MKTKNKIFSLIMFIVSLCVTVAILVCDIISIFRDKQFLMFFIILMIDGILAAFTYHYFNCFIYYKENGFIDNNKIKGIHIGNVIMIIISTIVTMSCSFTLIGLVSYMKEIEFFVLWYLLALIIFICYLVHDIMMEIELSFNKM